MKARPPKQDALQAAVGLLCGCIRLARLKRVQVVDGALRESRGFEDCMGVVLENPE